MRSVSMFSLALVVSSLTMTSAWGQSDNSQRAAVPGLLPLPEISTAWASGDSYPNTNYASQTSVTDIAPNDATSAMTWYQPKPAKDAVPTPPAVKPAAPMAPPVAPPDVYNALQAPTSCSDCAGNCGGGCGCCSNWYGYAGGLIMTRNQPNKFWTTYDQTNNNFQNLNTEMATVHWDGGGEFGIGYNYCCDCGIELTYWGIWNMNGSASVTSATNNLGTPMDVTNGAAGLLLGGQTPDSFFTNAHEALIRRNDQVNNVEATFTYNPCGADTCASLSTTWLYGFRFFNFNENLLWTSVAGGFVLGQDGGADQANLNVKCENELYGFQIGTLVNYKLTNRLSVFGMPKVGIYGDHATSESRYYRGDGIVNFDINGSKDTVSFLGSMDLGLNYQINQHWSVIGGYRVVAVSGIALSDNQIPHFLAAADEFGDVKTNGDLILHGAFFGATFSF